MRSPLHLLAGLFRRLTRPPAPVIRDLHAIACDFDACTAQFGALMQEILRHPATAKRPAAVIAFTMRMARAADEISGASFDLGAALNAPDDVNSAALPAPDGFGRVTSSRAAGQLPH